MECWLLLIVFPRVVVAFECLNQLRLSKQWAVFAGSSVWRVPCRAALMHSLVRV